MGFLSVLGQVLTYNQYKDKTDNHKKHGIKQFISIYNAHKDRFIPLKDLKWGEEMEYQIYYGEPNKSKQCGARAKFLLSNKGPDLIKEFNESLLSKQHEIVLMPEFGGWMVEAVPLKPYNSLIDPAELLSCEEKLLKRRQVLEEFFKDHGLYFVSMTNVPALGTKNHIQLDDEFQKIVNESQNGIVQFNQYSQSQFVYDQTINTHPRFSGLVQSIRERRGEKVQIRVPIFQDKNTNMTEATESEPFPGEIYMDAMHFGMGQCCLQLTYECSSINHARYLHDMLLPFTGIMAALSASGPIQKGKLSDYDLRWTVIEQCVDCRKSDERDPQSKSFIPKSRYSSMNHYISSHEYVKDSHNDGIQIPYNQEHKDTLMSIKGIDDRLANHIARLFARDPVPAYEGEFIEEQIDDNEIVAHFENIQSTNWNSLRFKPPPSQNSSIGWRVEFRTMDIQLTDFENTCLIVALGLIVNVVNHFDVNFIIPITLADENMKRAHYRDAILKEKFWFNTSSIKNFVPLKDIEKYNYLKSSNDAYVQPTYEELYIHEIFGGKTESNFSGIYSLIKEFMELKEYNIEYQQQILDILDFLMARATGQVPTGASFIRQYVTKHPLYKQDSNICPCLNLHLIGQILRLNRDDLNCNTEKETESDSDAVSETIQIFENMFQDELKFDDTFQSFQKYIGGQKRLSKKRKYSFDVHDNGPVNEELIEEEKNIDDQNQEIKIQSPENKENEIQRFNSETAERVRERQKDDQEYQNMKTLLKQKICSMDWSKDEARSLLLGNQWFLGRTGFSNQNLVINGQVKRNNSQFDSNQIQQ